MEWYSAGALLLGTVLGLIALGTPVALAFLLTNLVGTLVFVGSIGGLIQMVDNSTSMITRFTLMPIPFFILMGALFFESGVASRVFDALDRLFGRLPGRLCFLTLAGGTMFSTLTGSSMANTAMLGSLMVPEMQRRGYSWRMSLGPVLGTGGLAMIIPPSNLGVLLASLAGIDVGRFLIAGIFPGLILSFLFGVLIAIQVWRDPDGAPSYAVHQWTLGEKIRSVATNLLPMGLIVFMVIGLVVLGIATPTEASAFGVLGVLLLAFAFRLMSWNVIRSSLKSTVKVCGMVFFIIVNSSVFSQLLSYSGASTGLFEWTSGFDIPVLGLLLIMFLILLVMGMFMDPVSMMLITIPIFFPLISIMGVNPIWFGIVMLVAMEMSQTTPPFGLLLFIIMGVAPGTTLFRAARAAYPFLICDSIMIVLIYIFPAIVLYLPGLM